MIKFREKTFSEYDAMRSLYVELMKTSDRYKFPIISQSDLPSVLNGNSVVIEKFVISTSFMHADKYRIYLKIGARAKLPDEVKLPGHRYDKRIADVTLEINKVGPQWKDINKEFSDTSYFLEQRMFKNNNNNNNGGPIKSSIRPDSRYLQMTTTVDMILAEAIVYDKKSRTLVLEADSIRDIINALNILPFGLNYKIYLLDA